MAGEAQASPRPLEQLRCRLRSAGERDGRRDRSPSRTRYRVEGTGRVRRTEAERRSRSELVRHAAETPVIAASSTGPTSSIMRPLHVLLFSLAASATPAATFNITYNGLPTNGQVAFQYAADIWGAILESDVPIKVMVTYFPLGGTTLGITF